MTFLLPPGIKGLKPLLKKRSKSDHATFRLIFLLTFLSRVVYGHVKNFSINNNILRKYQSGFTNNYSTDFCLSFSYDKILKGFENGLLTGITLTDLQKTYDTLNHKIVLVKLRSFDIFVKT